MQWPDRFSVERMVDAVALLRRRRNKELSAAIRNASADGSRAWSRAARPIATPSIDAVAAVAAVAAGRVRFRFADVATLVLVGFSCSGKTSTADALGRHLATAEVADSDKWIERHIGCSSISNIHYTYGRARALELIETAEQRFLTSRRRTAGLEVIAAGPFVPTREPQWRSFVTRGPADRRSDGHHTD